MSNNRAIVVGGGLAGLSAAHTLLERGASVLLLDKQGYVLTLHTLPAAAVDQARVLTQYCPQIYGRQLDKGH